MADTINLSLELNRHSVSDECTIWTEHELYVLILDYYLCTLYIIYII